MESKSQSNRGRQIAVALTVCLVIASIVILTAGQARRKQAEPRPAGWNRTDLKRSGPVPLDAAVAGKEGVALRLTLRPDGFDPYDVEIASNSVILFIDNGALFNQEWTWRLERITGQRLVEQKMQKGRIDWNGNLTLIPGDYFVSVVDHPEWTCRIFVHPDLNGSVQ